VFVDGVDIGDVADVALRDRRMLSADGIFIVVATVSAEDGSSVADPEVIFRGVPSGADAESVIEDLRGAVVDSLKASARDGVREITMLQANLHDDLAEFVYRRLKRRPMVLPVVVEV
jgi:ribonuclease J